MRRTKRVPLLLLGMMAVLFGITLNRPEPWAGWLQAFAEAGMVGALADWFAVVALFRHPLGLPIPHTAIVPRRKDEIGESLARFVAENFLHPDVVKAKLESINLAQRGAQWLKTEEGREQVVSTSVSILGWVSHAWKEEGVRKFLRRFSRHQIENIDFAPLLGNALDWLVQDGRHQKVLTQTLRYAVILLHDHRETIRGNVQQESPWWLPGFVDDKIVQQMLDRIESLLLQMSLDDDHPMRDEFDQALQRWAADLRHSPDLKSGAERIRQAALDNDDLQEYLYRLWIDLVARLERDLRNPDSVIREQFNQFFLALAEEMEADQDMQKLVNRWLVESAVVIVGDHRHGMASLISETVQSWDADETSRRVELAIGTDLQFIRINGTLVGGLVGLLIHAIGHVRF